MTARGANAAAVGARPRTRNAATNVSMNPFLSEIAEEYRPQRNVNDLKYVNEGETNRCVTCMELTLAEGERAYSPIKQHVVAEELYPTPPISTNPFITPTNEQHHAAGECIAGFRPQKCNYEPRMSTPVKSPFADPSTPTAACWLANLHISPSNDCHAGNNSPVSIRPPSPGLPPFTTQENKLGPYNIYWSPKYLTGPSDDGAELHQNAHVKFQSPPQSFHSPAVGHDAALQGEGVGQFLQNERIPILQPDRFDGSRSWRDFLYHFESCAEANHWTEKTKVVQLRFCLLGAAGAIIHKNPRSASWSFQRIVEEIEAAYGPSSEHAAAIGIELRQRVRRPGEALHTLRDDIYEKVAIVYGDCTESEQERISVEIFTNALTDTDIIQKLLEDQPKTLAEAYQKAHRFETTRSAARAVTQLMRSGVGARGGTIHGARAAPLREYTSNQEDGKAQKVVPTPSGQAGRSVRRQAAESRRKKTREDELICHNCSGVGHFQKHCPSPRWPMPGPRKANLLPSTNGNNTVVIYAKSPEEEMCVQIMIHGVRMCALLDSGARRKVLPLHLFHLIPNGIQPPISPSTVHTLQGIGPEGLAVLGEVDLPVNVGCRVISVNFIIADTTESTEVILGHPFLLQTQACLDYGSKEITLFGEKVPPFKPDPQPATHLVRVARTTVLEAGCEYIVPGTSQAGFATSEDLMLSPAKAFVSKHHVMVARSVVQPSQSLCIPIRVFNPSTSPVTLKKGVVAGVLQPAQVVGKVELSRPKDQPSHDPGSTDLGRTNVVQHDILTTPGSAVKQQPRRMSREKQEAADQQVQQSLEAGLARHSNSSWAAPIVMVKKKDQSPRLCVDYRPLNDRTIKDAYPLPRIQDTLDTLSTAKYFSTLDLTSGYWQVEMTPRARKAAAFCTRKGLFEWNVMPFGLCNAPATFQRLMDRVLAGLQWEACLVYLDDIIVLGCNSNQMMERLEQVFTRLRQANLKLKPSKCRLFQEQVAYLGHVVSAQGISTDPQKIQKVQDWPIPKNISEVRQFVGLASYYRRFVADFATIARPLHELTKKYARFDWTTECQEAFEELKERLTSAPILGYPLDSGELLLDTDASDWGVGAVLSQVQGGEERVLAYGSRRLTTTEQNYCTTRRELLAVVEFTSHFRQYLLGRSFVLRTDHSSLRWLTRLKEPEGQLARWLEKLAEYDFQVLHRPGKVHQNADALSRRPCRELCACKLPDPSTDSNTSQDKQVQCEFDDIVAETTISVVRPVGVAMIDQHDGNDAAVDPQRTLVGVDNTTSAPVPVFSGWTHEELQAAQKADSDMAPVFAFRQQGDDRPPWAEIASLSPATKAYWAQWKRLFFKNGVLMRKFYCKDGKMLFAQTLLPKTYRHTVMQHLHEGPIGGHFGAERTLGRLKTRYYWYNMRDDVTLFCQTCASCACRARPKKTPQAPMGSVRVGAPMERIAVDVMGPLNETDRHNRYILVVQDYFSKWVEAYPVPNEQATTVAEKIVSEWVCRYGAPYELHSDQGANFESAVFQGMCELLGINKTRTTPFRPQSDGQVERFNATLQKTLAATAERCHWDWDIMIPYALMPYRATKHSSTGLTPNMMLFGREITEPMDLVVGLPPENLTVDTAPEYVQRLRQRLELSHQLARSVLGRAVERAKRQYDKNICQVQYKIGDAVWYLLKGTKRVKNKVRKFLPSYEGPYFVVDHLDDLVYRIKKGPRSKAKIVHHDKLKLYHSRVPLDGSWVSRTQENCTQRKQKHQSLGEDYGPLTLWNESSDTEECVEGTLTDSEDAQTPCETMLASAGRPQRARRAPNMFGEWILS
ncbi:uncharacterized protein LOC144990300 [Oryzias latipes]